MLDLSLSEVAAATGISEVDLAKYEEGKVEPSGDDLLILSDLYKRDYKFFISNEPLAPFEQIEETFRRHGDELSKSDRMAILEFLHLCECEEQLLRALQPIERRTIRYRVRGEGERCIGYGRHAAIDLRHMLDYSPDPVPMDVYMAFRRLGFHIFRRRLGNSNISGLYVRHPVAGDCILVNYDEDAFRQRFRVTHEIAHALVDNQKDVSMTFKNWSQDKRLEAWANNFAAEFLMPREFLTQIVAPGSWDERMVLAWAERLMVNPQALAMALGDANLIEPSDVHVFSQLRLPALLTRDPELHVGIPPNSVLRRKELLERGLSNFYVKLCFDAYEQGLITYGRLANMLLVDTRELREIAVMFGRESLLGD